jgi:flagellar biosynthesis protein FlhG
MINVGGEQKQGPLVISIGGGKGGVGKSMVSSNLAVQYAQAGMKVILLDLDFGAANLHTIFGQRQPATGLGEYFTTPRSQLQNYLMETELPNLFLVPGSGFVPELANLRHMQKLKLINQIRKLDADLVMLDLGAGSSNNVVDFFSMTQAGMVVTTPEPTAIVNAYEFLKNVVYRILFRMFRNDKEISRTLKLSTIPNNALNISTVADLIYEVKKTNPWAAKNIEDVCKDLDFYIIFNQARKHNEAHLGTKLRNICLKHLCLNLNYSGIIYFNEEVPASVFKMRPISLSSPESVTSKTITRIATHTMKHILNKAVKGEGDEPFEQQLARVMKYARFDFESNLLVQKSIERKRLQERITPSGNLVNLGNTTNSVSDDRA